MIYNQSIHFHTKEYYNNFQGTELNLKKRLNLSFEELFQNNINDTIYLFSIYRTPIERKISSFLHHIELFFPDFENENIEDIIKFFNETILFNWEYETYSFETKKEYEFLFRDHLENLKFDHSKKYIRKEYEFNGKKIIYINFRYSEIGNWAKYLSEIFNEEIELVESNISSEKSDKLFYDSFRSSYKLDKRYLDYLRLKIDNPYKEIYKKILPFNCYDRIDLHRYLSSDEVDEYIANWEGMCDV